MITLTNGAKPSGASKRKASLAMGGLALGLALLTSANQGLLGSFLRPAMSAEALAGWWGQVSTALILALLIGVMVYGLLSLSRKAQLVTVWCLLALGALGFFLSFNLSFEFIGRKLPFLITTGAFTTLYVSAISIILAFLLALLGASAKMSGIGVIEGIGAFYTSYFRGVPLLVQLFLIYLGLPQVGIIVPPVPAAIAALALVYGAYMTEIFRSGIQSIPAGQWEAADALGLPRLLTFRKVILPQAMRVIVPPTGNQFIAMLKDSSLVSVVGVWDIMFIARTQGRADFKILEMLITASVIYWMLSVLLEFVQQRIEAHYAKAHQR